MSEAIQSVMVRGQGAQAWLAALLIARFAVSDPANVSVDICGEDYSPTKWVVRPSMGKLHAALGLDLTSLDAVSPICLWAKSVPFLPYGQPLENVSFVHLKTKIDPASEWSLYNPAFSKNAPSCGAYLVSNVEYEQALKSAAIDAGVQSSAPRSVDLIVETRPGQMDAIWQDRRVAVGASILDLTQTQSLGLHVLSETVMSLVRSFPDRDYNAVETQEYVRQIDALSPALRDMDDLISGRVHSDILAHRISVWSDLGRIIPVDHDPFEPQEWMGAMISRGYVPKHYHRLADILSESDIRAHLERCKIDEANHVAT